MTVLCVASCARKGWHNADCDDQPCGERDGHAHCGGCQPWPAADGARLCVRHQERIGGDALEAARLYDELALMLAGGGSAVGEKTSGSKASIGINLSDAAVEARRAIRRTLASWTLLVAEERGLSLPETALRATESGERVEAEVLACGAFLAVHADWLAAHQTAGEAADELSALVRAGRAAAYPSGARRFAVTPCQTDGCAGALVVTLRDRDDLLPPTLTCNVDPEHGPEHGWPADQWRMLRRVEVA